MLFAVSLRVYTVAKSKIEPPVQQVDNEHLGRVLSQKWLIGTGAGILVLALVLSVSTMDYLESYSNSQEMQKL